MDKPRNFYRTQLACGDKMCERLKDASVIQTVASYTKILYAHHWKDTPEPKLTMTKIVLLWLLSKTIVNISYYIVGHVPRTISLPCGLFLKKGGKISCVVTGPRQLRCSRDLEKLLRDQQRSCISANQHVPFPYKVYVPIRTGLRKYSVPSFMVSITR